MKEASQNPFNRLTERFLPQGFINLPTEEQRKTYLSVRFALLFGILGILYAPIYVILVPIISLMTFAFGISSLIILLLLSRGANLRTQATMLVALITLLIVGLTTVTEGAKSPVLTFLSISPVIGILLISRKAGMFWAIISICVFLGFWFVDLQGITLPNLLPPAFARYFPLLASPMVIFLIFFMVSMFEQSRLEALLALETEKASVEEKVEDARAELKREQEISEKIQAANLRSAQEQQQYLEESARQILDAMQSFAFGDLTVRVESNGREDDISKIFTGFNRSIASVEKLVQQVIHNVEQTSTIALHISSASGEMAATSSEQSAQINQIASNIDDMARAVSQNAHHAVQVNVLTQQTGHNAELGADVVNSAMKKIEQIAEVVSGAADVVDKLGNSSAEIGEIVQVIEEIADQTNLLALNAAIEAARAGEQGRGFAVVADEVRKLAERTAQATKQISQTIKQIQTDTGKAVSSMQRGDNEVREGLTLAKQAGEELDKIVKGTQQVAGMVSMSSQVMEQQSSSAEQISKSIEQMSASIEETTSSLGEIAHSTETLRGLTESLQELIGQFEVRGNHQINVRKDKLLKK